MKISVGPNDVFAQNYITQALGGKKVSKSPTALHYRITGGGDRPVAVFSLPGSQMGKKRFALKVDACDFAVPTWIKSLTGLVLLVLNQDYPKHLYHESRHILSMLCRMTVSWVPSKNTQGRGGWVVFMLLWSTGRIITTATKPTRRGNSVVHQLTGFDTPVVAYGTSDASNVFELLQTLKAASYLGLPAMFDSYDQAYTVFDYWQRIMQPSLALLDGCLEPTTLGLDSTGKFIQPMNPRLVYAGFQTAGLVNMATLASELAQDVSFAEWYRQAMRLLAKRILSLLEKRVEFALVKSADLLAHAPFWRWSLARYALELEERTRHRVVAIHRPDGTSFMSDAILPLLGQTVAGAHEQGWWLGGAGIYWGQYALGQYGGIIFTVKDSVAGQVHLLARPYLEEDDSGLYLLPVGLFRLTAQAQKEDWSVDPWVFLELLTRWGEQKSRRLLQEIWQAIEVPLERSHIGRKTVATVDLDGVQINIQG